jgi:hypothetical protein
VNCKEFKLFPQTAFTIHGLDTHLIYLPAYSLFELQWETVKKRFRQKYPSRSSEKHLY